MLKMPRVKSKTITYLTGMPAAINMAGTRTSKAIGTGKTMPTRATSVILIKIIIMFVAGITSAKDSHGSRVIIRAPRNPARIINGTVVLTINHRFLAKLVSSQSSAFHQF